MGFLIVVTAAGTACLEYFGWTSDNHLEIDAKVWQGIVAIEVGMSGDIKWVQTKERRGADTEKELVRGRLERPVNFSIVGTCVSFSSAPTASPSILSFMVDLVPAK